MALADLLRQAEADPGLDVLREGVRVLAEALMALEVEQHLGAAPHERTPERTGQRNGYRERAWDTRVGTVDLRVPRVRDGGYFPALLEPRTRAERALVAVVQEAYVAGVSTRRVDDLIKALGLDGISKSQVSRLCAELDAEVARFRGRPLTAAYPYVWLDATFVKVREAGRVVSQAVVVAVGVTADGVREVLGVDIGPSEDGAFWLAFLRSLVARGLRGVRLATSDAHEGLRQAIGAVLHGASWQRCRVHFVRNALALVPKGMQPLVAATIRTVFAQPTSEAARVQWRQVADGFRPRWPRLAELMEEAEPDVLAYLAFPPAHWRQLWSTNPLERLNKELKRRTDVVGIFEWQIGRKYVSVESLAVLGGPTPPLALAAD
ncbi:MAG: IS256 family transposase [Chloroflexota bacterium]|nr:IS256 family transposase [Chloroflexota bacterium]